MAKNNNTATKSTNVPASVAAPSGPVSSFARLAELKAKKEELAKLLAAMNEEVATAQTAVKTEHWGRISELPAEFGCESIVAFRSMVNDYIRGLESGNPLAGSRKPLTKEEKAKIETLLRAKTPVSQISAETNRSVPTIQALKKALGLVKERGASTLSGPAATFSLPAGAAAGISPEV